MSNQFPEEISFHDRYVKSIELDIHNVRIILNLFDYEDGIWFHNYDRVTFNNVSNMSFINFNDLAGDELFNLDIENGELSSKVTLTFLKE